MRGGHPGLPAPSPLPSSANGRGSETTTERTTMLMSALKPLGELEDAAEFTARHVGPDADDERHMLSVIGAGVANLSRRALIDAVVPRAIARSTPMALPAQLTEAQALAELKALAAQNRLLKSFIGQGYHGTHTPGVILRNVLENPAWYTAYTPYQAEISQGRMEALVNFQTMVCDLTGMAIANASMLDEATAAAEAMTLARRSVKSKSNTVVVAGDCHAQTIEVIQTRAAPARHHRRYRQQRPRVGRAGGRRRLLRGRDRLPHDHRGRCTTCAPTPTPCTATTPRSSSAPTCWR